MRDSPPELKNGEDPEKIRPRLAGKSDCHATPSTIRPMSGALGSLRLLRATRPNEKLPVHAPTDLQRPGPATDVAVPNQLSSLRLLAEKSRVVTLVPGFHSHHLVAGARFELTTFGL